MGPSLTYILSPTAKTSPRPRGRSRTWPRPRTTAKPTPLWARRPTPFLRAVGSLRGRAELCRALLAAEIAALHNAIRLRRGELPDHPLAFDHRAVNPLTFEIDTAPQPTARRQRHGLRVREAAKKYLAEKQADADAAPTPLSLRHIQRSIALFAEHVADCPIAAVTRKDASAFLDRLAALSARLVRGRSADTTLAELERVATGTPTLSNKTLNGYASDLHGLFKWARRSDLYHGENPFADQRRKTPRKSKTKRLPFEIEELNALLAGKHFAASRAQRVNPARHRWPCRG